MADYKKYLKTALVGDGKIITYRQLARELKVHVNVAKEMLYAFHHDLNLRKPSSCHATYILSGLRRTPDSPAPPPTSERTKDAEGDEIMSSSPLESSQVSSVGEEGGKAGDESAGGRRKRFVRSIVLVGEERETEIKASFEVLSSIHVYSIEPTPLSDMLLLADNSLAVMRLDAAEATPQDLAKKYGSIMNPHAKRRTGLRVAPPPAATPAPAVPKKVAAAAPAEDRKSIFGKKVVAAAPSTSTSTPTATTATTTAQGKRAQVDFFKAFGGAGAKKENKKADDSPSTPAPAKPKGEKSSPPAKKTTLFTPQLKKEDSKMDIDELEEEDEEEDEDEDEEKMRPSEDEEEPIPFVEYKPEAGDEEEKEEEEEDPDLSPPPSKKRTTTNSEHAQRRAERSAKLRAMMDDSDDEEIPTPGQQYPTTTPPAANPDEAPSSRQEPVLPVIASASTPARRRARRRVNKRTTTRDKDGYLVTQNEMVWESYSEDEPEALPQVVKKERPAREKKEETELGKKKAPAKKGAQQGNIMRFFGRK